VTCCDVRYFNHPSCHNFGGPEEFGLFFISPTWMGLELGQPAHEVFWFGYQLILYDVIKKVKFLKNKGGGE